MKKIWESNQDIISGPWALRRNKMMETGAVLGSWFLVLWGIDSVQLHRPESMTSESVWAVANIKMGNHGDGLMLVDGSWQRDMAKREHDEASSNATITSPIGRSIRRQWPPRCGED